MKYYMPIAPLALLRKMQDALLFGTHHMVLAHEVLADPTGYEAMFKPLSRRGHFILMDNSAVELDQPIRGMLLTAAATINATCVCLPDKLRDREGTVQELRYFMSETTPAQRMTRQWMMIPQGKSYEEITRCAHEQCNVLDRQPEWWGIPRWIANDLGSRRPVIEALAKNFAGITQNVHLLGMSKNLHDDLDCLRLPCVSGIDSANPVVLGQLGVDMVREEYSHAPRSKDGWDFWKETELQQMTIHNVQGLRAKIAAW